MYKSIVLALIALMVLPIDVSFAAERAAVVASPNGRLEARIQLDDEGSPTYSIFLDGKRVLDRSRLGLVRDDGDFTRSLELVATSAVQKVADEYELLTGKRRLNRYEANRATVTYRNGKAQTIEVIFQVANDGVAFRYFFPEQSSEVRRLSAEATSFRFLEGTRAYLQPIAVAKTGWSGTNPSYEEIYQRDIAVGTPSPTGAGWVFPALFRSGETWILISETGLGRTYAGTRLQSRWRNPEYTIGFPDPLEGTHNGPVAPQSSLPWLTPWRLVVIGDLRTIVESTMGTDLADKPRSGQATPEHMPGKASWSWPLLGDSQTIFETQKRFIDYAADMRWQYTLVDALWDRQIGYEKLKELVDYGRSKGVKILVWYNSAGDWNDAPQTPRDLMLTHESRVREFERLKAIGVAGLKVDFFAGDGQSTINYYQDILEDAAPYGFAMNFHGATLPRGWHRTYPHLMTMEAVRGLEFVTFEQRNADEQPTHAAMLPFTRNVFEPMDFTPVVLDRINGIERRTSSAFELALSVLFTSGIQHYAEIPEGMAKAPDYVREFLRQVPSIWEDVRFLTGDPGKYVAIARRSGKRWYIAGINGERTPREFTLDLSSLGSLQSAALISDADAGNLSFKRTLLEPANEPIKLDVRGRGGFVIEASLHETTGTGPFPALKEEVASLPDHVVYRPADLSKLAKKKLGVLAWGNGGCADDGASSRLHLLEIASHGYLAIANGTIKSGPGTQPAPPRAPQANGQLPPPATSPKQLTEAIDWALAENKRKGSELYGRIDPAAIAVAGYSCGGLQALQIAGDKRLRTVIIHNSGIFSPEDAARLPSMDIGKGTLKKLHTPVLYIQGGPKDIAYNNGMDDFRRIEHVPAVIANLDVGHGGTFMEPEGGRAAQVAVAWLEWQLRGDEKAKQWFVGPQCRLCADPEWTIERKHLE